MQYRHPYVHEVPRIGISTPGIAKVMAAQMIPAPKEATFLMLTLLGLR